MVREAGSPSLQKQTVKPECLRGMESGYEDILFQLGRVIKAKDFITYKYCDAIYFIQHSGLLFHDNFTQITVIMYNYK